MHPLIRDMRISFWFCRYLCQCSMILLMKSRVFGLARFPARGAVLVVSNHQSYLDPVLATMALPREGHYMARDTLFNNRWFGGLIRFLNAYPVKRGTADMLAIKETMRRLKEGRVVLVFPEGTRSQDGRVGPMLGGLATVARKCKAPIVPALVDGVYKAWPRDRLLPGWGDVIVEYGAPITPEEYASMSPDELTDEIRRRIVVMQEKWHRRVPSRRLEWYGTNGTATSQA